MNDHATTLDRNALANLRDMVGGDEAVLADLTRSFLDNAPRMIRELTRSVETGDAGGVRLHAHSLKGNANDFGALDFAALCLELELMGKTRDLGPAPVVLDRLKQAYSGVERALRQLLESLG